MYGGEDLRTAAAQPSASTGAAPRACRWVMDTWHYSITAPRPGSVGTPLTPPPSGRECDTVRAILLDTWDTSKEGNGSVPLLAWVKEEGIPLLPG